MQPTKRDKRKKEKAEAAAKLTREKTEKEQSEAAAKQNTLMSPKDNTSNKMFDNNITSFKSSDKTQRAGLASPHDEPPQEPIAE